MEKAGGRLEALCEQCSGGKATAFCRHCTEFICEECVKSHQKMKAFAEHKVSTIERLRVAEAVTISVASVSTVNAAATTMKCIVHDELKKLTVIVLCAEIA